MTLLFKKITLEDAEILREFSYKTFYETFAPMNTPENMQAYLTTAFEKEKVRAELENEQSSFYFLYSNGELAGYLKLNEGTAQSDIQDNKSLEVERIYVSKDFQGKKLGKYLMEQAIQIAYSLSKAYVWLGVWEKNEHALNFYKKYGFYEIGTHSFFMGTDEQTDYIMRKDLL